MDYSVFVNVDGASVEQVELARATYRSVLDQELGGHTNTKPCFIAYTKAYDGHPVSPKEAQQATAWHRAEGVARTRASSYFRDSLRPDFLFRLNH